MSIPESFLPYPLKFIGILKERVWGGRRLASVLGKTLPEDRRIGESWEVADRGEDTTVVANGPYAGVPLSDLRERWGEQLIGPHGLEAGQGLFPLLIKFIDASETLSVQVHPTNEYAALHHAGELGKTEAWYVIHADPGARIVFGLKPGADRDTLKAAIDQGTVEALLQWLPASAGDCFFTPAGTAHALGAGLVVYEVQQNSDVTYRFYDWNRLGLDGKPRELHVEHSLNVLSFTVPRDTPCTPVTVRELRGDVRRLIHCPFFVLDLVTPIYSFQSTTASTGFHAVSAIAGQGDIRALDPSPAAASAGVANVPLRAGESVLIPASLGPYEIRPAGSIKVLRTFVPPK